MQVYIKGQPLAIRNHPLEAELRTLDHHAKHVALITRADVRHAAHAAGYDARVSKLYATMIGRQLYRGSGQCMVYCQWILLSDGTKYRASWIRSSSLGQLFDVWERCAWPLKGKGRKRPA